MNIDLNGDYKIRLTVIWLTLMMAIPDIPNIYKYIGLAIVLIYTMISDQLKIYIRKNTIIVLVIWILFFSISSINSFLNGFEFSIELFTIYFIRPICILLLCSTLRTKKDILFLVKSLIYITLFVSVYNAFAFMGAYGIIPDFLKNSTKLSIVNDSFLTTRTGNQTALLFLTAFVTQLFFKKIYFSKKYQLLISITFFLAISVSMLSGRRVLQIVTIIFILLSIAQNFILEKERKFIYKILTRTMEILVLAIILVFLLSNYFEFNVFESIYKTILDAFNVLSASRNLRNVQKKYLITFWKQRPFLGWGLSAYIKEYINWKHSFTGIWAENKWSFEYFYYAFLYQNGLIGVSIVIIILCVIFSKLIKVYLCNRKNIYGVCIISIIYGSLSFFVAGYTNPLVTSMWMWYILLSVYFVVKKEPLKWMD